MLVSSLIERYVSVLHILIRFYFLRCSPIQCSPVCVCHCVRVCECACMCVSAASLVLFSDSMPLTP